MILEHSKDPVSARWRDNHWDIGEKKRYRWITNEKEPKSEWFYDIKQALDWIQEYDRTRNITIL